jgi:Fe2+ transport system protein FeoA
LHNLIPVHMLDAGQKAEVHQLMGDPGHVRRLEEMGLRQGAPVEVLQPGNPCIIRLSGLRLCIRPGEVTGVLVKTGAV